MPLDVVVSPQTVTATLYYLKRGAERPARYLAEPPPGVPVWNGIDDPREMTIEDARGRETEFTIDRNGFQLVKAPTDVQDFYSPEEVRRVYYPEVERLLGNTLSASRVFVFDHECAMPGGRARVCRCAGFTTITRSIRRRGECAITWATTRPNCSSTGLASSMCGGQFAGQCSILRWHCATRRPSRKMT